MQRHFTLKQFRYFVAVAESASVAGAARVLNIAQSAVTRSIQELEDTLGLPLLFEAGHMLFFDMGGQRLMVGLSEKPEQPIGGTYIYFDAPDVGALASKLRAKGVELIGAIETLQQTPTHDLKLQFFRDPDGNKPGLMGMVPKGGSTPPDRPAP